MASIVCTPSSGVMETKAPERAPERDLMRAGAQVDEAAPGDAQALRPPPMRGGGNSH